MRTPTSFKRLLSVFVSANLALGSIVVGAQDLREPRIYLSISQIHHDSEYQPGGDARTLVMYVGELLEVLVGLKNFSAEAISIGTPTPWYRRMRVFLAKIHTTGAGGVNPSGDDAPLASTLWTAVPTPGSISPVSGELRLPPKSTMVVRLTLRDELLRTLPAGEYQLRVSTEATHLSASGNSTERVLQADVRVNVFDPNASPTHQMEFAARRTSELLRQQRFQEARVWAEHLVSINPSSVVGLIWLGDIARVQRDCRSARTYYNAALESLASGRDQASIKTSVPQVAHSREVVIQANMDKCVP